MLQILGLRAFEKEGKTIKYDAFFDEKWRATNLQDLFENLASYLAKIPEKERWNLFFTPNNCTEKKREFQSTQTLFFDLDGIDTTKLDAYIKVVCESLRIRPDETGIVFSGRGLHFYIGLLVPIVEKDFFKKCRDHYKALTQLIDKNCQAAGLPVSVDPSVFDARRLMRLPGTLNRKPERGADVLARLIQPKVIPINFDLTVASGIPLVQANEQIDKDYFKRFPQTDSKAIFEGCDFLRFAKETPHKLNEPQWYAALSITARMEKGAELSHEISRGHPGYSPDDTDLKIHQAMSASGPRTCASINQAWGRCHLCPSYQKVNSPIMLRPADALETEHTGFYHMRFDPEQGKMVRTKPCYSDLLKFFERQFKFVSHDKFCWVYRGTHWQEIKNEYLESFAQKHFDPFADTRMTQEFKNLVHRSNLVDPKAWANTRARKVNFKNGVLDLDTMVLGSHSHEYGFKYVLPYDYDPAAKAPAFEKFLSEVMNGNKMLVETLLQYCGYSLSGDECRFQKALVLDGEGSNGKSTFIDVLKAVAGAGSYQALSFQELNNLDRRAALDGALFNITEETPNKFVDATTFKNLVTGGELNVRRLYKDSYAMRNRAKLIFSCNALPATSDSSGGFYRRFLIVRFTQLFTKKEGNVNIHILSDLLKELPGIFNLFLAAYQRLVVRGSFEKEDGPDADVEEYQQMTDTMVDWFKSCVELTDPDSTKYSTCKKLFESYLEYSESAGVMKHEIIRKPIFQKRLTKLIPGYKQRQGKGYVEGSQVRLLHGVLVEIGGGEV